MKTWKSKLFGDNHLSFYGWLIGGMFIITGSLFIAIMGLLRDNTNIVLLGLYSILVGMFCLQLQNYHSTLAEKLDTENGKGQPE